jgi:hypothetical protein
MYERRDENNVAEVPQPASNLITVFGGSEGWSQIQYRRWNGDYSKRDINNQVVSPGTYSKRDINNQVVSPGTYQRTDINNNPISL